nr:hypothetical protein [Gemmatimonadaceae bacterium]
MLRTVRSAALAAVLLAPAALQAQDAPLPAARDLVARHVAAIGGRDAVLKYNTIRSTGTFGMAAAGLQGDLVSTVSKDGRMAMRITVPGMGELAGGYNGTVGWSMNPMQGPRVLDGPELAQMKEEAGFISSLLRQSPTITSIETVEKSSMGGVDCYKVKVTYASGRVSYDCYGIETGLLAGQVAVQESAMGTMELHNIVSDWKEFGGVKFATVLKQQAMGQEQVMTITSVSFDSADDAALLELPAAVK